MTENDKAWQRNTPQARAERRANWQRGIAKYEAEKATRQGRKPEGGYAKGQRWT